MRRAKLAVGPLLARSAPSWITPSAGALAWLEPRGGLANRLLLASMGTAEDRALDAAACGAPAPDDQRTADRHATRVLGAAIERACHGQDVRRVVFAPVRGCDVADAVEGMMLRGHMTNEFCPDLVGSTVERITVCTGGAKVKRLAEIRVLADATNDARGLADLPGNVGTPSEMVRRVRKLAKAAGLRARTVGPAAIQSLGMGLVQAVGQGATEPARILVLEHAPRGHARSAPLVLLGKGVTHDTGGYDLKRAATMHELTYDKCGAMGVVGAMLAIARLRVPTRVVAVLPLAENAVDARAYKPGDILRAMDGSMVYVGNTDAEGRLLLADCLTWIRRLKPAAVVDLATLTSGCSTTLGDSMAGLFSNHGGLRDLLLASGRESGDLLWPLPIHPRHVLSLQHARATLSNVGAGPGQAANAAAFLRHFVQFPWAHIDMAGQAHLPYEDELMGEGATGFGARLLVRAAQRFARDGIGKAAS